MNKEEPAMDQQYFLGRMEDSLAMAWAAKSARAKLVHFDLAGRYSVAAARAAALHDKRQQPPRRLPSRMRSAFSAPLQKEHRAACTGRSPADMLALCDAGSC
jgi:hypothetical protein